ncbi:MAG: SIS domain-containing protein [Clostridia bacterium]|nr:SIS domain-containing protein [Clostridia bacterium]
MELLGKLNAALGQLPGEAVERAARCVLAHDRVFVGAAGRSGLMLKAFAMRLMQAGRTVYVAGETVTPAIGEGDLLFLASASGATPSVIRYAEVAKKAGADLFVVTASEASPLTAVHPADIVLPCGSKDQPAGSVMGTLFEEALLIFCDAVIQSLPADPDCMRRRHANLE